MKLIHSNTDGDYLRVLYSRQSIFEQYKNIAKFDKNHE